MTTNMSTNDAEDEKFLAPIKNIDRLCMQMHSLLHDPEPGLASWIDAVKKVGVELHTACGFFVGAPKADESAQEAMMFLCTSVEEMATRLSAWKERGCTGAI